MIKYIIKVLVIVTAFSTTAFAGSHPGPLPTTPNNMIKTQVDVVGNSVFCTDCFGVPSNPTKVEGIDGLKVIALNESGAMAVVTVEDENCDAGKWFVINKRGKAVAHQLNIGTCEAIADVQIEDINNFDVRITLHTYGDDELAFVVKGR